MSLTPPWSKSDAQRALVLADVLGVPFESLLPAGEALPRDVEVLRAGLVALRERAVRIDCRDGGAPFRFLLSQAAVLPGREVEFVGTQRLGERPHAPLVAALRASLGAEGLRISEGTPWPVQVHAPASLRGPFEFQVTGEVSSQYASSLLLAAARLSVSVGQVVTLTVDGALTSEGYFRLTQAWLERTGFAVADRAGSLWVSAPPRRLPFPAVPGDWSSIVYLLVLSWVSGLPVARVQTGTGHPDEWVATLLRQAGFTVSDRLSGAPTAGLDVDAERCPDSVPTLAALATRLPQPSVFRKTGILKVKESDRLEGTCRLLRAAGVRFELTGDALTVHPGAVTHGFFFDAHDDHRMAMTAAVLARLHGQPLRLHGMASVGKSFPGFWAEAAQAGVQVEEATA